MSILEKALLATYISWISGELYCKSNIEAESMATSAQTQDAMRQAARLLEKYVSVAIELPIKPNNEDNKSANDYGSSRIPSHNKHSDTRQQFARDAHNKVLLLN